MYLYPVRLPSGDVIKRKSVEAAESEAELYGGEVLAPVWQGKDADPAIDSPAKPTSKAAKAAAKAAEAAAKAAEAEHTDNEEADR